MASRRDTTTDVDEPADLAERAKRVVDRAPTLTQEQRARLVALLRRLPERQDR